jgi:hypothetical protein
VGSRALTAGCAALASLAAPAAANVEFTPVPFEGDVVEYYQGALFQYLVRARSEPLRITAVEVNLRDYLQLVNVYHGEIPLLAGDHAACAASGNQPFAESALCDTDDGCPFDIDVVASADGAEQHLDFIPSSTNDSFERFEILVRFCGAPACLAPEARFVLETSSQKVESDTEAPLACGEQLTRVDPDPQVLDAPRSATAAPAVLELTGLLGGTPTPLTAVFSDPAVIASAVECAPPNGSFVACNDSAFTDFAVIDPVPESPERLEVTAKNVANPIAGDGRLRIDANQLLGLPPGTLPAVAEVAVQVEQDVTAWVLGVLDSSGTPLSAPFEAGAGDRLWLEVLSATNAVGGFEPRTATWSIASATFDGGTADPSTEGWLTPGASDYDRAALDIPATVFDGGTQALRLQLQAVHQNPHGPPLSSPVEIRIEAEGPTSSCRIVAAGSEVSLGGSLGLALERVANNGQVQTLVDNVTWEPSAGSVVADGGDGFSFRFLPPDALPADAVVNVAASSPACPSRPSSVMVTLWQRPTLTLNALPRELRPGGAGRLRVRLTSTGADVRSGLRFLLDLGPGLEALAPRAIAEANATTRELEVTELETLAAGRSLSFAVDVLADGPAELSLPVLARAGFANTVARATLQLFYPADLPGHEPAAVAEVSLRILDDAEFAESTLVGTVFHDRNGDGKQQAGESGLADAMVAVAAGVYAITDERGRYHIARLAPGRHAVKIDAATLPVGAELTTDELRTLTLTPGVFSRVHFGVRLPDHRARDPLVLAPESGLLFSSEGLRYRAQFRGLLGARLVARHLEKRVVAQVEEGEAVLELPVEPGGVWTLAEVAGDGRLYLWSFTLLAFPQDNGTLVMPHGPRPLLQLVVPPPGRRVAPVDLTLVGEARAAASLEIAAAGVEGCEMEVNEGTSVRCSLGGSLSGEEILVRIDPDADALGIDGPQQSLQVPVKTEANSHFLVGHLDAEVGLDLAGDELLWPDGGAAFLYKGRLENGWQLTAGADMRLREVLLAKEGNRLRNVGAQLFAHDPTRIFRDLDPEEYYPTYGDASLTVDERESGGRFYLRVQKDTSYVKWGGINTAIDDAEVGRFVRSLYGLGGVLELADGELALSARAFVAQPDTVPARDELTVTGGSLYFLGHRQVVEGSLRVVLEVLDEISGLPVRATPLTEGADFEADYAGGRIILDAALPYRMFGSRLTSGGTGGHRGRLIVEYEYLGSGSHDWSLGGRVVGVWGPVSVGATGVAELAGLVAGNSDLRARYGLAGGTLRLDLGEPLRLRVEVAHSDGGSVDAGRSSDGGLSFSSRVNATGTSGSAVVAEVATALGGTRTALYGRYVQPGFSDTHTAPGRRLLQGGARLDLRLAAGTRVWGNLDHRESQVTDLRLLDRPAMGHQPLVIRDLALLGAAHRFGPADLKLEGRYEAWPQSSRHQAVAAAEVAVRLSEGLALSLRRRQLLAADSATRDAAASGETAAGIHLGSGDGLRVAAEAGADDDAEVFARAQATVPVTDDTELYAGYQIGRHRLALDPGEVAGGNRLVAGGRRLASDGTLLYSEQSLAMEGKRMLTRTVGARVPVAARTHLSLSYERGALDGDDTLTTAARFRDALAVGAGYTGERWTVHAAADGRLERAGGTCPEPCRTAQVAGHGRLDFRASDRLTLAVAGRGASGFAGESLSTTREAWEGAVGVALRSGGGDALDLFARYALTYERDRLDGSGPWLHHTSHVVAAAAVYDVWGPVAVAPKLAYRYTRVSGAGVAGSDQALLAALRGDLHLSRSWDATVEGRACAAPESIHDARAGALVELSLLVLDWLRLGGGYNFSAISASGVRCEEPGARGLFLRAEAIY